MLNRSVILGVIVLTGAGLVSAEIKRNNDAPAKQKLGTIYLDQTHGHKDSSGPWLTAGGDISDLVINRLQELGFEVISFQGIRPKAAKLSIVYKYQWRLDAGMMPYIGLFDATLMDAKHVIGQMTYHAPALRERGEKLRERDRDVIGPVLTDLMQNFEPDRAFPGGFDGPKLRPSDPSELLPEFTPLAAKNIKSALAAIKFPIKHRDLIERLGGKDRFCLEESAPLETTDHLYGVVDYALSDVHDRQGYFFLELILESPPRREEADVVKAAFLMFNAHGIRFAQAPAQPVVFKKISGRGTQPKALTSPPP